MITIQSGKLIIPEEDRFVGFAGDNLISSKSIVLPNHGVDNCEYTLYLRFDDDTVRSTELTKSYSGSDLILTWNISSRHLVKSGIVMAQVKYADREGAVGHTECDYFVVASGAENAYDGDNTESVSRAELEERIANIRQYVRESAPYIDTDGYWRIMNHETGEYERSISAQSDITVDTAMSPLSENPIANSAVKAYVDAVADTKADKSTTVAGLPLDANISRADLAQNLSGKINPPLVTPDVTVGYRGQFGLTSHNQPVFCTFMSDWHILAEADNVYTKSEIDTMLGGIESMLETI